MARLRELYKSEVAPALMKKFNYKSPMQIPRFDKIVINVGTGDAKDNAKRNGITNAIFHVGKAEEVLPEFYENKMKEV